MSRPLAIILLFIVQALYSLSLAEKTNECSVIMVSSRYPFTGSIVNTESVNTPVHDVLSHYYDGGYTLTHYTINQDSVTHYWILTRVRTHPFIVKIVEH